MTAANPEPQEEATVPVTVLLSGGVDSAACLAFYAETGTGVEAVFVDYGQPAAPFERTAAKAVADVNRVPLSIVECRGVQADPTGDIPGRNGFLYFIAVLHGGDRPRLIATGIHSGTPFYDCSGDFLRSMDSMVAGHTQGRVRIVAPFLGWTKPMILQFCEEHRIPLDLLRSCDSGSPASCGECRSCLDRTIRS